ncbi:MAG: hypothetical protein AB1486_07195 [Planctomycetota bacterium]
MRVRCVVLVTSLVWVVTSPAAVPAPQIHLDERESFHNSAFLRQREEIDALLFQAESALEAGRLGDVVRFYRQALAEGPEALVSLGERCYVCADRFVRQKLSSLGEDALRTYRESTAATAAAALEQALRLGSEPDLRRVARLYPLVPEQGIALLALAERAFEEGRFAAASYYATRLLDLEMSDPALRASARARLELARACRGESGPSSEMPEGLVVEGGPGESSAWPGLLQVSRQAHPDAWPTLLGSHARLGWGTGEAQRLDFVGAGRLPLRGADERTASTDIPSPLQREERTAIPGFPSGPLIVGELAILVGEQALRFVALETGRELFGPLRYDFDLYIDPAKLKIVPGSASLAVDGERAYLALNVVPVRGSAGPERGYLFALDLTAQAKPLWRFEALRPEAPPLVQPAAEDAPEENEELATHDNGVCAVAGPPLVVDGEVCIAASQLRDALTDSFLVRIDGSSGRPLSWTFLCSASRVARFADRFATILPERVDASPLAESDGLVYVLTNLGVVAAVAACTGEIEWAFKYNRLFAVDSTMYHREALYDTGGWPPTPIVVEGERLYVAPMDSRYFYSLARLPSPEGYIILDDPIERGHLDRFLGDHVLGSAGSCLLFEVKRAAGRIVAGTDRAGGAFFETPPFEPEERLSGWPVRVGSVLFVPTNKNIYRIDLEREGLLEDYVTPPLEMQRRSAGEAAFGSLAVASGYLVSQSRDWYALYRLAR